MPAINRYRPLSFNQPLLLSFVTSFLVSSLLPCWLVVVDKYFVFSVWHAVLIKTCLNFSSGIVSLGIVIHVLKYLRLTDIPYIIKISPVLLLEKFKFLKRWSIRRTRYVVIAWYVVCDHDQHEQPRVFKFMIHIYSEYMPAASENRVATMRWAIPQGAAIPLQQFIVLMS